MDVRWMWIFVDALAPAGPAWDFWQAATRSARSATRGDQDEFATLLPAQGDPWVKVQEVRSGGGIHLDLDVPDPLAAAEDVVAAGAREVFRYADGGCVILRSPGGFVFCLTRWDGAAAQARAGEPDLLDQLCLDIPAASYEVECAFWGRLLGADPVRGSLPEFRAVPRASHLPVRILLQRKDSGDGPVTGHVDFACADRQATRRAHEGLGAAYRGSGPHWTVMRAPGGQTYCLTDRDPETGTLRA
ncbi:VOC family protein [Nostocoides australiense]